MLRGRKPFPLIAFSLVEGRVVIELNFCVDDEMGDTKNTTNATEDDGCDGSQDETGLVLRHCCTILAAMVIFKDFFPPA